MTKKCPHCPREIDSKSYARHVRACSAKVGLNAADVTEAPVAVVKRSYANVVPEPKSEIDGSGSNLSKVAECSAVETADELVSERLPQGNIGMGPLLEKALAVTMTVERPPSEVTYVPTTRQIQYFSGSLGDGNKVVSAVRRDSFGGTTVGRRKNRNKNAERTRKLSRRRNRR